MTTQPTEDVREAVDDKVWKIVAENYSNSITARKGVDKILDLIEREKRAFAVEQLERVRAAAEYPVYLTEEQHLSSYGKMLDAIELAINEVKGGK
jgi:hypothetical protein